MPYKISVKLIVRDSNTKRKKESEVSVIVDKLSLDEMRHYWNIERAFNDKTPIRCHVNVFEVPDGATPSPNINEESQK